MDAGNVMPEDANFRLEPMPLGVADEEDEAAIEPLKEKRPAVAAAVVLVAAPVEIGANVTDLLASAAAAVELPLVSLAELLLSDGRLERGLAVIPTDVATKREENKETTKNQKKTKKQKTKTKKNRLNTINNGLYG